MKTTLSKLLAVPLCAFLLTSVAAQRSQGRAGRWSCARDVLSPRGICSRRTYDASLWETNLGDDSRRNRAAETNGSPASGAEL